MLYVFLVVTGAMLTFEMELAMESVETLMTSITSTFMSAARFDTWPIVVPIVRKPPPHATP
jgi:hypothetical protein